MSESELSLLVCVRAIVCLVVARAPITSLGTRLDMVVNMCCHGHCVGPVSDTSLKRRSGKEKLPCEHVRH